ncbi:uncharacterized protein LOC142345968 isoform X2 [Convolutriloba macropyga]|uniref:uncharacterized protein LOC142345968 isoform X2 n=1 Tax=Convolutriloba macropyga TaxID=536237 RepID=UPI003F52374E
MPYLMSSLILSISMSVGWTIAPFIIGHPKYQMEFNGYFWGMDYGDKTRQGRTYIVLLLVFEYCIPLMTIAGIYAEILRRMVKQSQRAASALKTRRITIICALSTAAFIAGWTPYATLTIVSFFDINPGLNFVFFANAAAKLSCVYNCSMFWASTRMGRQRDVTNSARSNNRSKKDDNSSSASNPVSRFKSSAKSGGPSSARLKLSDRTNTTDGSKVAVVNAISARDVNSDPGCTLNNKDSSGHDGERSNREKFKKARRSLKSFKKKGSKKEKTATAVVVANFASSELTEKQVTEKQTQTSTLKLEIHTPPNLDANAHSSTV